LITGHMQQQLTTTIHQQLREYRLSGMRKMFEVRVQQAQEDNIGYSEFLALLLEDERSQRADNKRKRLYKKARLPYEKGLDEFDFSFQPSIKKKQVQELATGRFVERHQNILLIGQPGTGKTHLSVSLALEVLGRGGVVLFTTVWDMINTLQQSRADYSYQKKIQQYLKPDLLILDELGYRSMAESTVEDFFAIVTGRYEKGSIIITSNRPINEWDSVFIDKTLTTAIVDRLIHHCHVIQIKGESYRYRNRS